jgi:hypothetical protein
MAELHHKRMNQKHGPSCLICYASEEVLRLRIEINNVRKSENFHYWKMHDQLQEKIEQLKAELDSENAAYDDLEETLRLKTRQAQKDIARKDEELARYKKDDVQF